MRTHVINLFMWGYQPHFRLTLQLLTEHVFEELGILLKPDVLLVGARRPGSDNRNPVCVEPEDGKWQLTLFENLLDSIESTVKSHRLQNMIYGDEPSMRDLPETIRRDSVTTTVDDALKPYDIKNGVRSFCGSARPVGDYYVVPVIQTPEWLFTQFPPLEVPPNNDPYYPQGHRSLIHSSIATLLDEASKELLSAEPGRSVISAMRSAAEIVHDAATRFMRIPAILIGDRYSYDDLFERFNIISSLLYEGTRGTGHLVLVNPESEAVEYLVRFKVPVPFQQPRWARKVLQMATSDVALIANSESIFGLGKLKDSHDGRSLDAFTINFLDHYQWELQCGTQVLMYSRYREARLPQEPISQGQFTANYKRLFPRASMNDCDHFWTLFKTVVHQRHGSMIVVAEDAEVESERLAQQGMGISPVLMTPALLERMGWIDGTIIVDPHGFCHALGVILDGEAAPECTPSRGSRYNSALRYVLSSDNRRLAIVVSDDRTVDVIPMLRPQIKRDAIEWEISELEKATVDSYHKPRMWLDEHRFYLNREQCDRVNRALDRLDALPREEGQIVITTNRFKPDPRLNDTYFITE